MVDVELVKDLGRTHTGARQCLVKRGSEFFCVSSVVAFDTGKFETLAFPCDAEGNITSFREVAGGIDRSRAQVLVELAGPLSDDGVDDFRDDLIESAGSVTAFVASTLEAAAFGVPYDDSDTI